MLKKAVKSQCETYRYILTRAWDIELGRAVFIGLNPSTADHEVDDNTIVRCINFTKRWGMGSFEMVNLFAYRATKPSDMKRYKYPTGINNDRYILEAVAQADIVVAMWGCGGTHLGRDKEVVELLEGSEILCFGKNKDNTPKHPLYLANRTELIKF